MSIKDIKLIKGMSREEVNDSIGEWLTLEDDIYLGVECKHTWRCKCGNIFERVWNNIKNQKDISCKQCKYKRQEERYKYEVEKDGEYEYIRSFRRGDVLSNGKVVKNAPYIQVKHKYCGSIYEVVSSGFIKVGQRCGKCCQKYENSFAYHMEVELGEPLEKYWDFEKNTVNPYLISKNSSKQVWIKCANEEVDELNKLMKKDYHNSHKTSCHSFVNGNRCGYCYPRGKVPKVHLLDSFGYRNFDKVQSWHPDNDISPFKVAPSSNKKYKFICPDCNHDWIARPNAITIGKWCPQCNSSKGEKKINAWMRSNNIDFIPQKEFSGLVGIGGGLLSYDFYLPDYNLLIEYQGEQHKRFIKGFHYTKDQFRIQQEHDKRKKEYSQINDINLLEIWYWDFDNIEEILKDKLNI